MNLQSIPINKTNLSPLSRYSVKLSNTGSKLYSPGTLKQSEQLAIDFNSWNNSNQITIETVKNFLKFRMESCSNETVRQNKYLMKSLLVHNFQELNNFKGKKLLDLELSEINIPASPSDKTNYTLSKDELINVLPKFSYKQQLLIRFLYNSACRVSEGLNCKLINCKLMGEEVHIDIVGKGNKRRYLRIDRELFEAIKTEFKSKTYLFQNYNTKNKTGKYSSQYLFEVISRIETFTGKPFSPHKLRHSRATNLIQEGESIEAVSEFLGHSSVVTTAKYYLHNKIKNIKTGSL